MSIVSLRCDECGNPLAGCKAVDCTMRSYTLDREATLDEHENAIKSIDPKGYYGLSPLALGKIIAAYFDSLREQGVSTIDPAALQAVTMERDMLRDQLAEAERAGVAAAVAWLRQPRGQDSGAMHAVGFAAEIERELLA